MMKRRVWKIALLLSVPLVLMVLIALIIERNSWRPRTIKTWAVEPGGLQFSPDGRTLVLDDSELYVFDVASSIQRLHIAAGSNDLFLENGNYLTAYPHVKDSDEGRLAILSVWTGQNVATAPKGFLPAGVLADGATLIGRMFITNADYRQLFRWNWRTDRAPKPYLRLRHDPDGVLWILPDKAPLTDGKHFWELSTGKLRFKFEHDGMRYQRLNPSSSIALNTGSKVRIWNVKTGEAQSSLTLSPPAPEYDVIVSPDGTMVSGFSGMSQGKPQLNLWDMRNGQLLRQLEIPRSTSNDYRLAFSHDSCTIAVAIMGKVILWRIK